jgi:hypothetical protein
MLGSAAERGSRMSKTPIRTPRASSPDVKKAREAANVIVKRALADKAYRRKLFQDPAKTLKAAGVPVKAIEDIGREIIVDGKSVMDGCDDTCHMTCLVTCMVTGKGNLPGGAVSNPGG